MPTTNPLPPIYNESSRILILGSMPSVKSREAGFYYMHPQNRFWKVLGIIFECDIPQSAEGRRQFLLDTGIALSDVVSSCNIEGSSDSSIETVKARNPIEIIENSYVKKIFLNGRTAEALFNRYLKEKIDIPTVYLPSTSPANASFSLSRLTEIWKENILPEFYS